MVASPIRSLVEEFMYQPRNCEFARTGHGMNDSMIDVDIEGCWAGPGGCDLEAGWSRKFTEILPVTGISTILATILSLLLWKIGSGSSLTNDDRADAEA